MDVIGMVKIMKLTTEQMLVLLDKCTSFGDTKCIATMLGELLPFWDGPTFGHECTAKVHLRENSNDYACILDFHAYEDKPEVDYVAISKHVLDLRYECGRPVFRYVDIRIRMLRFFAEEDCLQFYEEAFVSV